MTPHETSIAASCCSCQGGAPSGRTGIMRIKDVAIYGAGSIGTAWAVVFAHAGHDVRVYDPDIARLNAAKGELNSRLEQLAEFDLIQHSVSSIAERVVFGASAAEALSGVDYVQE